MPPTQDFPYQDGDVTVLGPEIFTSSDSKVISWKGDNYVPEKRLRLAHKARRAKEHQLDDIRRALCDIGFMDDDDPYSHADLADVIRQNGQADPSSRTMEVKVFVNGAEIGASVQADIERHMQYIRTWQGGA